MNSPPGRRSQGPPADRSPEQPAKCGPAVTPHFRSQDLFGLSHEVMIEHNERTYRLRLTAQGKLILTA